MITEEQIKELAHAIWEQEGRPHGKDVEHYFRAQKILEEREVEGVVELAPPPQLLELAPQAPVTEIAPPPVKRKRSSRRERGQG